MNGHPELLIDARLELGEGPAWDAATGRLYFVDIHAGDLYWCVPDGSPVEKFHLGEPIGCAAPTRSGAVILALRSGFYLLDPSSGRREFLATPEAEPPGNRFNDGKCDPVGRFLAGSMEDAERESTGSLYSMSSPGRLMVLLSGLGISNGLTWSPDGRTFYFIDTPTRIVMAYDYRLESGLITNPRPVVRFPPELGWPDGMTSDEEGMLWVAAWGGGRVTRWDPKDGRLLAAFPVPAPHVSACIFGGPRFSELYITTARKRLTSAQLAEHPLSGGLFRLATATRGLPTYTFGG